MQNKSNNNYIGVLDCQQFPHQVRYTSDVINFVILCGNNYYHSRYCRGNTNARSVQH